jgi:2-methylisocitrate lyase-like PEP mutase family enzyme
MLESTGWNRAKALLMHASYGTRLRDELEDVTIMPFIGVYDVFSATIAGRYFDSLFISGFGFAASYYGLPDIGFIAWSDMVSFVQRVRTVLPQHHLLVDIDDGYCDPEVACHVVSLLERAGASGVVLEDQKRPRKCGHFDGKQIMDRGEYVAKLKQVLATRRDLYVVARTDSSDPEDMAGRMRAYADAGADALLVDGLRDIEMIRELKAQVSKPIAFNQIAGGKSQPASLQQLGEVGARLVIYSTPCLFAAQGAMESALASFMDNDGDLSAMPGTVRLQECSAALNANLCRRESDSKPLQSQENAATWLRSLAWPSLVGENGNDAK